MTRRTLLSLLSCLPIAWQVKLGLVDLRIECASCHRLVDSVVADTVGPPCWGICDACALQRATWSFWRNKGRSGDGALTHENLRAAMRDVFDKCERQL